jgi:hypothetical protein
MGLCLERRILICSKNMKNTIVINDKWINA